MSGPAAWVAAIRDLGGDVDAARSAAADLARRWAEPHRRYHTTRHLEAVLRDAGRLADAIDLDGRARAVVALAACAHDVVYDARPGSDELASAEWARQALAACRIDRATVERVTALVLATVDHAVEAADLAGAVLSDADLAILAAAPEDYAEYVSGVRAEYAAVPEEEWRRGRARVLAALVDRHPLYATEPGRAWWEERARRNVTAELSRLTDS